jgi:hypothetical protein
MNGASRDGLAVAAASMASSAEDAAYSAEEEAMVSARLEALGYL